MKFLFRDMCTSDLSWDPSVDDGTTITLSAWRLKIGTEFLTDYRYLNPLSQVNVPLNFEELLRGKIWDDFENIKSVMDGSLVTMLPAGKDVLFETYDVLIDKLTGVRTYNLLGTNSFNNVIDGVFGTRMIKQMELQDRPIFLGGFKYKYLDTVYEHSYGVDTFRKRNKVYRGARDYITVYSTTGGSLRVDPLGGNLQVENFGAGVAVLGILPIGEFANWTVTITIGTFVYVYEFEGTEFRENDDGWGRCWNFDNSIDRIEDYKYEVFLKNQYGGIETLGTLNLIGRGFSGSSNSFVKQKVDYKRTGNANDPYTNDGNFSKFTSKRVERRSNSVKSYTFETNIFNLDEDWGNTVLSSENCFMKVSNENFDYIVECEVTGINFEQVRAYDGDLVYYRVTYDVRELIGSRS